MNAQSFPVLYSVSVPVTHWSGELATDIFVPCNTPVLAVFDGYADANTYPLGGYTVTLRALDGFEAYYAHLSQPGVSGWVNAGDVIGYVGDTGNAKGTGCHLHFAVGVIDSNGAGSIRPSDWLSNAAVPTNNSPIPTIAEETVVPFIIAGVLLAMLIGR